MEEGTLSILRRGTTYQVRYASNDPYAPDRQPQTCPDAATLDTLLQHLGAEATTITQACTTVQHGGLAVFCMRLSPAQIQAYFPLITTPETSREAAAPWWRTRGGSGMLSQEGVVRPCWSSRRRNAAS